MDRPDDTLHTVGLRDVARHFAMTAGITVAVARMVDDGESLKDILNQQPRELYSVTS
jgi:hypothetical protein